MTPILKFILCQHSEAYSDAYKFTKEDGYNSFHPQKGMINFHWLLWCVIGQIKHSLITSDINSNRGLVLQAEISMIDLTQAQQLLPSKSSSIQFLNRSRYLKSSKIQFPHYYQKKNPKSTLHLCYLIIINNSFFSPLCRL